MNSLLSLLMIVSIPTMAILLVNSRYISKFDALKEFKKARAIFAALFRRISLLAGLILASLIILSPAISHYLHIDSVVPIMIISLTVFFSFIIQIPLGTLQGLQKFIYLGLGFALLGIVRFLSGIFVKILGYELNGAVASSLVPCIVVFVVATLSLRNFFSYQKETLDEDIKEVFLYSFPVIASLVSFAVLIYSDMFLVKHYFSATIAGSFAGVAVLGRTILYMPAAIVLALFPMVSESHTLNQDVFPMLKKALSYTLILSGIMLLVFLLIPEFMMTLLFGEKFLAIAPLLRWYAMAMIPFSLLNVFMNFNLARHSLIFVYSFIFSALLQVSLICIYHKTLMTVLYIMIGNGLLLLSFNLALVFFENRRRVYAKQIG